MSQELKRWTTVSRLILLLAGQKGCLKRTRARLMLLWRLYRRWVLRADRTAACLLRAVAMLAQPAQRDDVSGKLRNSHQRTFDLNGHMR